jgi:hypothetical protein
MDAAGLAFPTVEALCKFVLFIRDVQKVPQHTRTFIRLLERVRHDLIYANVCRAANLEKVHLMPQRHGIWLASVINAANRELSAVVPHLPGFLTEVAADLANPKVPWENKKLHVSLSIKSKVQMVLDVMPEVEKHEHSLIICHASLLEAVSFLQKIELFSELGASKSKDAKEDIKPTRRMRALVFPAAPTREGQPDQQTGRGPETTTR